MNKFKTDIDGGLPLRLNDFRWSDEAYREAWLGLMSSFGVNLSKALILSGCTRTVISSVVTISAGYVCIGGEVCRVVEHSYPVPSLSQQEYWVVQVSYDNDGLKPFQDTSSQDTYEIRIGKVMVASVVPVGYTLYNATKSIFDVINSKVDTVPIGVIMMWSGSPSEIPFGYRLCDGLEGTPDLRGRFVVGYDNRSSNPGNGIWDANYNSVSAIGGEKNHALLSTELPQHSHPFGVANASSSSSTDPIAIVIPSATSGNHSYDPIDVQASTSGNSGAGAAHNNLPPYYVICYIQKVSPLSPVSPSNPDGQIESPL